MSINNMNDSNHFSNVVESVEKLSENITVITIKVTLNENEYIDYITYFYDKPLFPSIATIAYKIIIHNKNNTTDEITNIRLSYTYTTIEMDVVDHIKSLGCAITQPKTLSDEEFDIQALKHDRQIMDLFQY